jgi:class 3 adenylate cyclase
MLVQFASAVDAVRSAVEVQRSMAEQNAAVPQDQMIQFRIGIHVGDIIIDDNDIFGDGVNIAARLEGIAEPGDELCKPIPIASHRPNQTGLKRRPTKPSRPAAVTPGTR